MILAGLIGIHGYKGPVAETLGVDDFRIHVGEDFENRTDAQVVPVAGDTIADLAWPLDVFLERFDTDQLANLAVTKNSHNFNSPLIQNPQFPDRTLTTAQICDKPPIGQCRQNIHYILCDSMRIL